MCAEKITQTSTRLDNLLRAGQPAPHLAPIRRGAPAVGSPSEEADFARRRAEVEQAVLHLLQTDARGEERRWQPRVLYVREASILFAGDGAAPHDTPDPLPAITTDISFGGIGVLTWQQIAQPRLILQVCDVRFACKVRWSLRIAASTYRSGLVFCKLVQ